MKKWIKIMYQAKEYNNSEPVPLTDFIKGVQRSIKNILKELPDYLHFHEQELIDTLLKEKIEKGKLFIEVKET